MSGLVLILFAVVAFIIAFNTYGSYVAGKLGIDPSRQTPAHTMADGVDYVPAKAPVLMGHHFASIAGAAPIVGPISAAVFGWLPAALWIIFGSIFIGAVHDFSSLFASVRHGGRSIGDIIGENIGKSGKKLFLIFVYLTLLLILAVFANIIANTFASTPSAATASILFIVIAVFFGQFVYRQNANLFVSTVVGVALLIVAIWLGNLFPIKLNWNVWVWLLFIYAFVASVAPVWILLQPRDYLNSFLLYALIVGGVVGIILYNPTLQMPAYGGFQTKLGYLFPILFVTIACGAISGFHSLVSSGTTSKQISNEKDSKLVGYGSMLIEGTLATVALISAAYLTSEKYADVMANGGGVRVFSTGVAEFMTKLGVPLDLGVTFAALVVSAFALTTLDTALRLARFAFEEYFAIDRAEGAEGSIVANRYFTAGLTAALSIAFTLSGKFGVIWPIFGSANQLLASLAFLAVAVWLARSGKDNKFLVYPMIFMFAVTLVALLFMVKNTFTGGNYLLTVISVLLFILALFLISTAQTALKQAGKDSGVSAD